MTRSRLITLIIFLAFLGWFAWGLYASARQAGPNKRLVAAIDRYDAPTVWHLLAEGADPNTRKDGTPPPTWHERWLALFGYIPKRRRYLGVPVLVVAAAGPDNGTHIFPKNGYPDAEIVRMLLAKGADINAQSDVSDTYANRSESGQRLEAKSTALVEACRDSNYLGTSQAVTPTERILLDAGADVHSTDSAGETALHYACSGRCSPLLIQMLLDRGADVNACDQGGDTPLIEIRDNPIAVRLLLAHGADPNAHDRGGTTPLIEAVESQSYNDVRILLSHGVDINAGINDSIDPGDDQGETPLMCAVGCKDIKVLSILLDHGASVNAQDEDGQTVLFYTGNVEMARLLIAHGAKVNIRDRSGNTPLKSLHRYATDPKNFPDLVQRVRAVETFLISHGGQM